MYLPIPIYQIIIASELLRLGYFKGRSHFFAVALSRRRGRVIEEKRPCRSLRRKNSFGGGRVALSQDSSRLPQKRLRRWPNLKAPLQSEVIATESRKQRVPLMNAIFFWSRQGLAFLPIQAFQRILKLLAILYMRSRIWNMATSVVSVA